MHRWATTTFWYSISGRGYVIPQLNMIVIDEWFSRSLVVEKSSHDYSSMPLLTEKHNNTCWTSGGQKSSRGELI